MRCCIHFIPARWGGPALVDLLMGKRIAFGQDACYLPVDLGSVSDLLQPCQYRRPATGNELCIGDIPDDAGNTFLGCTSYYLDAGYKPLIHLATA